MNTNLELHTKYDTMLRVRTVCVIRIILTSPIASLLFGIALACYLSILVSLGDVLANTMAHVNWSERFSYAFSSLLHSSFIVQTIAVLITFASFAVLINSLRKIRVTFGSAQQV